MRERLLGKTGLSVSELSLGTRGLSGDGRAVVPEAEQDGVSDRASALGITLFETADRYAKGGMEARLGERLAKRPDVVIVTKLGTDRKPSAAGKNVSAEFLRERFERSRERLSSSTHSTAHVSS